jgi:GntR family transcriptional regulator, transcriptional repressor for pyruvate dehydrogenase complex
MSVDGGGPDGGTRVANLTVERVRPAYEQVAQQLRELIIRGEIAPGDRLPVESDLPALFGVSRSTIREALRVLSSQNLVGTRRGMRGGTFVLKPQAEDVRDYLEVSLGLMTVDDNMGIDDLIEVRELLEVPAARLAAARREQRHLDEISRLLDEHGRGSSAPRNYSETRGFHETILDAAGNTVLTLVTRPIFGVLQTRIQRAEAPPNFWHEVNSDHKKIAGALIAQDQDAAARSMHRHLEHLRTQYERLDRKRSSGPAT